MDIKYIVLHIDDKISQTNIYYTIKRYNLGLIKHIHNGVLLHEDKRFIDEVKVMEKG